MTYNDIITSINYKIENSNFEKFPIAHVIDELNNTYRDLANKTEIFETYDYLQLIDGQAEYTIPARIYRPTRAVYGGTRIDFKSQEDMDMNLPGWSLDRLESAALGLDYLVYNNLSDRRFKTYPILLDTQPSDPSVLTYMGQATNVADTVNSYMYFDVNTGLTYLSDVEDGDTSVINLIRVVTIYGVFLPPKVEEINLGSDIIYIDETQVNALIYGTAGNLLFTSGRTEDAAKATNYMKLYGVDETEVAAIRKSDFSDGFRNTSRNTNYRTPFNR